MKYYLSFLLLISIIFNLSAQSSYETGYALYYADYLQGRQTASGEIFNQRQLTCAHKYHPFGTLLKVTRQDNGMSVIVRVNDRGPFCEGCSVDISKIAAERIDLIKAGKKKVLVQVVGFSKTNPKVLDTWSDVRSKTAVSYEKKTTRKPPSNWKERLTAKGTATPSKSSNTRTKTPAPPPPPPPAPQSVADGTASAVRFLPLGQNGYFIQLGAYTLESNARRNLINLQKKGMKYLYLQTGATRPNEAITRMFVGPFSTRQDANNYLKDVCPQYDVTGIVVLLR